MTQRKRHAVWGLAALAWLAGWSPAFGHQTEAGPAPNFDSLRITIHPAVDRGVDIDTAAVSLDLGPVAMLQSTFTVTPATVTILGTDAVQELDISAVITSLGPPWNFDLTPSTDATNGEIDALAMYALFSETSVAAPPSGDEYMIAVASAGFADGTPGPVFSPTRVGGTAVNPQRAACGIANAECFEMQTSPTEMDNLAPNASKHLWFLLRMPSQTTSTQDHNVTVTLTAVDES